MLPRPLRAYALPDLASLLLAALLPLSCSGTEVATTTASLDLAAMDASVKPGDDFYLYANGGWLKTATIAPDRGSTGVGMRVAEAVERRTATLLEEAASAHAPNGTSLQCIGDYYASYLDAAAIEARGTQPLAPLLARVEKLRDARELSGYLGSRLRADVDALNSTDFYTDNPLGLWAEQDLNDKNRYAPYLLQGGLGMPDRSYYLDPSERMVALRAGYLEYLTAILRLAGLADAPAKARNTLALETKIAQAHASRIDSEDVSKANNPWKRAEFALRAAGLDWDAFFAAAGLESQPSFLVWHPGAVTGLADLVRKEPLAVWKDYLTARAIDHVAGFLPEAFVAARFEFFGKRLRGAEKQAPRARLAMARTDGALGEEVGRLYVERHFTPETKRAVEQMVANLIAAFGRRIDSLAWMAPETKARAHAKLATLRVSVGYPDSWGDGQRPVVVRGDALGNFERAELFEYRRTLAKLGKPVDRGEWAMLPHEVNAVNLPVKNALNFPAAILSPPYFDPRASSAANYGSIGAVIGHEISHSFDDQGAKFDAEGKFTNWWTPADLEHFEASGKALAALFDTYKPFPDLGVDGKLTLSENIADLAGLAVAYEAWRASCAGQEPPGEQGFTAAQVFFVAFAQSWQEKEREATLRAQLTTDGHAPAQYRVLTVRNLDAWYDAFHVQRGDALWLEPAARVRVW